MQRRHAGGAESLDLADSTEGGKSFWQLCALGATAGNRSWLGALTAMVGIKLRLGAAC
jgi:hypothetical protein